MKKKAGLRARRAAAVGTGIAAAVAGGVLAGSGWAFDKAFRPKGDRAVKPDVVPDGPQYAPYADQIRRSVENAAKKPFEPVEILSGDGLYLFGRYYPGEGVWNGSRNSSKSSVPPGTKDLQKRPLALFFHGYRSPALRDGCGGFSLVQEMGYDLIMVDQRGHGGSEGNAITLGVREQYDCLDWIRYCVDRFVPWEMSMENFDAIPGEKELMIVPGAGHGMSWYLDQEGYRKAVKTFCRKILA